MELSIKNVQITLCRNNEYPVGLNPQTVRDQLDRHLRVARENLVEQSPHGSQVIHDDDGDTHAGWQMPKKPRVGVEATGRSTPPNEGKNPFSALKVFFKSSIPSHPRKRWESPFRRHESSLKVLRSFQPIVRIALGAPHYLPAVSFQAVPPLPPLPLAGLRSRRGCFGACCRRASNLALYCSRSEERRVGKECRSRW